VAFVLGFDLPSFIYAFSVSVDCSALSPHFLRRLPLIDLPRLRRLGKKEMRNKNWKVTLL
jgi:hypothetical protein